LNPLAFLNVFPGLYAAGLRAIGMTTHGGNMKQLPEFPDLSHLRKQAKQLLRAYRANDADAAQRIHEFLPFAHRAEEFRLHDAQSCIAREYGFASWAALKAHVEQKDLIRLGREEALQRWLRYVYGAGFDAPRPQLAARLLEERKDLPGDDPWLACAVGDGTRLRKMT
jgi:hypothetical protein